MNAEHAGGASREGIVVPEDNNERNRPRLVFVVGMPRSGTKLLRDLLNRHRDVAIFPNESHFIPYFHRRYGARKDLDNGEVFKRFFREFASTTFSRRLAGRGIVVSEAAWRGRMEGGQLADALRALFASYREMSGAAIVGDKTPEYLTQVPLLAELLPEARFVHIVRDPRDYALSMRNAWGKNMVRAVQRWKRHIRKYKGDVARLHVNACTVRYEDLVAAPEQVLTRVCHFLGIEFQSNMTSLEVPAEELGDARGLRTVLANNTGKWAERMSQSELRVIESIAGSLMAELGYQPATCQGDEDVGRARELYYRTLDSLNLFRFRLRTEGGLVPAIAESWRAHRHAGVDE